MKRLAPIILLVIFSSLASADLCDQNWDSQDLADLQTILGVVQETGTTTNTCADVDGDGAVTLEDEECVSGLLTGAYSSVEECLGCIALSKFEVCNDGIDNNCDGQTDRDTYDNSAGTAYSSDICECNAETPCGVSYDVDGIQGMANPSDVRWCRGSEGVYQWLKCGQCGSNTWCQTNGYDFDTYSVGDIMSCQGMDFRCSENYKWLKYTEPEVVETPTPTNCWTPNMRNTAYCSGLCASTGGTAAGCESCWSAGMKDSAFCKGLCKANPKVAGCNSCWANFQRNSAFCEGACTDFTVAGCNSCWAPWMRNTPVCGGMCASTGGAGVGCDACWASGMQNTLFCSDMCAATGGSSSGCESCWANPARESLFCRGACSTYEIAGCSSCWSSNMRNTAFCEEICADTNGAAAGCGSCWADDFKNTLFCKDYCSATSGRASGCESCWSTGNRESLFCAGACGDYYLAGCSSCWSSNMRNSALCEGLCADSGGSVPGCTSCWTDSYKNSLFCKCACAATGGKVSGCSNCWSEDNRDSLFCAGLCQANSVASGCSNCWTNEYKNTKFCSKVTECA